MRATAEAELISVIGEDGLVALAEAYAGTRLYVPAAIGADSALVAALGIDKARTLSKAYASDTIPIPLARGPRARAYRDAGMSFAQIAMQLGMTEAGVCQLFKRLGAG